MGRIMSFDQDGRMARDFDKSDYDFLCRYGRTPEEVLDENAKLRELCKDMLAEIFDYDLIGSCRYEARMRELGVTA